MQDGHEVWLWSESFTEMVEGLMREPPSVARERWDWCNRRERLEMWRRQVDAARELYREGQAEALRVLYNFWRTIADDVREQVGFARESYHPFPFLYERWSPAKKPPGSEEWRRAESRHG